MFVYVCRRCLNPLRHRKERRTAIILGRGLLSTRVMSAQEVTTLDQSNAILQSKGGRIYITLQTVVVYLYLYPIFIIKICVRTFNSIT